MDKTGLKLIEIAENEKARHDQIPAYASSWRSSLAQCVFAAHKVGVHFKLDGKRGYTWDELREIAKNA
jgi:hypothetical protein